jgi:hypothetical protein
VFCCGEHSISTEENPNILAHQQPSLALINSHLSETTGALYASGLLLTNEASIFEEETLQQLRAAGSDTKRSQFPVC